MLGFVRPQATAGARPCLSAQAPKGLSFSSMKEENTCGISFFLSYAMPTRSATTLFGATSMLQCSGFALERGSKLRISPARHCPGPGPVPALWHMCLVAVSGVGMCTLCVHPSVTGTVFSFMILLTDVSQLASCLKVYSPHPALPKWFWVGKNTDSTNDPSCSVFRVFENKEQANVACCCCCCFSHVLL